MDGCRGLGVLDGVLVGAWNDGMDISCSAGTASVKTSKGASGKILPKLFRM